jgi:geranylgeranyl reductase family protein
VTVVVQTDVLVCGLGPAGACAAAAAAAAGVRVLALDRKFEPGLPVQCAEFVPTPTSRETSAVMAARIQDIDRMLTLVGGDAHLTPVFTGTMIDRAQFDRALVAGAVAAGAECRFGSAIRSVSPEGEVHVGDGTVIRARVVIGADGPRSRVGEAIDCRNLELAETRQVTVDLYQPGSSTDIYLDRDIVGGYAWIFPKGERCHIGLGVAPDFRSRLKPLLDDLHAQLVAAGRVGREVHKLTGGPIPVGGISGLAGKLAACDVLLCGDAAGLANPVSGAGINAAVVSGKLAGKAAADIVMGKTNAGGDYAEEIRDIFGGSLARAAGRRRQLLQAYAHADRPDATDLMRGWIAYPEYWESDNGQRMPTEPAAARMSA